MMTIRIRTLAIALLLAVAAGGGFVYAGLYNIAATEQHTAPVYWLLDHAMRRSIKNFSGDVQPPPLADDGRVRNGHRLYREKCAQCHGAPGIAPDDLAYGMMPAPANLVATAREWPASEIYWVVRNGIKMSGMPAWEYRLSDGEIWDIVAFVLRLPAFSPGAYAEWETAVPAAPEDRRTPVDVVHALSSAGDPEAGKRAIGQYLCATCHQIPGIVGATKQVGPPLNAMASRKYIGGVLPNTEENMIAWLRGPQRFAPLSAMPDLRITEKDARDMAAYLSTLDR